ncbi:MAG: heterocyst frequency control protein PatD [Gloeomargarita sp. HHBFW_bins_162]
MYLPPIYLELEQFLERVKQDLTNPDQHALISAKIATFIAEIPHTFNQLESLPRSLGVEMHKQLNLLKNDLVFWQAARTSETQAQRWQKIDQRLRILTTYMHQFATISKTANQ